MEPDFWHTRWANNQIGFHEGKPNDYLIKFFGRLDVPSGTCVFLPMCGKSVDMLWLAAQGYRVLGVEISPVAVRAFFTENQLAAEHSTEGHFTRWRSGPIEILCGDFFALTSTELSAVGAVYDRAALIALPDGQRAAYVRHMAAILPRAIRQLLITLDYPQQQMSGPPFSVDEAMVQELFAAHCAIEHLESHEMLTDATHLQAKGLTRLRENAFLLTRR